MGDQPGPFYTPPNVPDTQHSVFYSYTIAADGTPIGSFERFGARSTRAHERIREIFAARGPVVKEIVWGGTDTSIDISQVELYNQAMLEAFGGPIFSLEEFNKPVEIVEEQQHPPGVTGRVRSIVYAGCVASDWSKDLDTGTVRVVQSMTFQVTKVYGSFE